MQKEEWYWLTHLTMASRKKPKAIIDFATLTGCMHVAMGDRYSGVLSNHAALGCMAVGAGSDVGERVTAFPSDEDYEEDLKSQIADIKQCTLRRRTRSYPCDSLLRSIC